MAVVVRFPTVRRRAGLAMAAGLMVCVVAGTPAAAQTAASQYETLQARERTLRAEAASPLLSVRRLASAYEDIVRLWPKSGYADNALWQAAGLLQLAVDRGGTNGDRSGAVRLLTLLKREYPTSSLVAQVDARLRALASKTATKTATAGTTSPAPRRSAAPTVSTRPAATAPATAAQPQRPVTPGPPSATTDAASSGTTAIRLPPAELRAISRSTLPKGDRIILEFSTEPPFSSNRSALPDQLQFTFSGAAVAPRTVVSAATLQGALARTVRVGSPAAGTVVLAIDLAGSPRFSTFPLYDPYRLVIDIEADTAAAGQPVAKTPSTTAGALLPLSTTDGTSRSPDTQAATTRTASPAATSTLPPGAAARTAGADTKPSAAASTSRGDYSLARQLGLGVARIVIDAGHGGHDPGAQANSVSEAELVLDVALRLEALLKDQPGFDVVLTRRTDQFIALEERTAIANREQADLFLSIHANSSPQPGTRGIETYFLNFAESPQAEAVAARENASTARTMNLLPQIVKAIALNNKLAESRELAGMVQQSLVRRLRVQNKDVQDLGVKQAPFMVLIGAQMPSVLAEISFLTNRADAALLKQPAYRQKIAQALADAMLKYQASLKKATAVAATR